MSKMQCVMASCSWSGTAVAEGAGGDMVIRKVGGSEARKGKKREQKFKRRTPLFFFIIFFFGRLILPRLASDGSHVDLY